MGLNRPNIIGSRIDSFANAALGDTGVLDNFLVALRKINKTYGDVYNMTFTPSEKNVYFTLSFTMHKVPKPWQQSEEDTFLKNMQEISAIISKEYVDSVKSGDTTGNDGAFQITGKFQFKTISSFAQLEKFK